MTPQEACMLQGTISMEHPEWQPEVDGDRDGYFVWVRHPQRLSQGVASEEEYRAFEAKVEVKR